VSRTKWQKGTKHEVDFWTEWFQTQGLDWKSDFLNRLNPQLPFQEYLAQYLPKKSRCTVLDVGAGPLTMLGKVLPGCELTIVAVDPLANEYDALLKHHGITPIVRTQYCEVERLSEKFPPDSFDLLHVQNALDHSYDPLEGIRQMIRVLKRNCVIFMAHLTNEAEKENYVGFHQWNFLREGSKFIMWNKENRIDVNEALKEKAEVSVSGDHLWNNVAIRKLA
jgi:SAM-dependent methyltransferase